MGKSDDLKRRMQSASTAQDLIATGLTSDLKQQERLVAETVRQFWDAGFDRATLLTSLLVGVVFIADNLGIPREKLIEAFREASLPAGTELTFDPKAVR